MQFRQLKRENEFPDIQDVSSYPIWPTRKKNICLTVTVAIIPTWKQWNFCHENGIILYNLLAHAISHYFLHEGRVVQGCILPPAGDWGSGWSYNFALFLKVWDKCARQDVTLKSFVRSVIYPFRL